MQFKTDLFVDIHDVDYNGVARLSSLMRYIQSAAQTQLTVNGKSYEELRKMKRGFILSRIKMEFTEPVRAYEPLTAITYPCESRGYSFLRCYALEKDGRTIGKAVSIWALIDTETRALVKVNDFELGLDLHEPHNLKLTRFTVPSVMKEVGTYTVNYGDVDQNCHMNNTRCLEWIGDLLPSSFHENHVPAEITVCYHSEGREGEHLQMHWKIPGDDTLQVDAYREGDDAQRVFTAQIRYGNLSTD